MTRDAPTAETFPIEKVRASFPALEREVNGQPVAYLDSGASSQRVLASIQAVDRYERRHHSNVHRGSHTLSAEATAAYEGARATVADHIGAADRREVVFVRNATEAINLVARAWGDANVGAGDRIVLTEMEHHSNIVPWQQLAERTGAEIDWVGGHRRRACSTSTPTRRCSSAGPKLVAVAHVSNVLGTENPLAEISRLAHEAGALVLADGAQAAPKLALDVAALGVDFYALTGHKVYGADRDRRALGAARPAARDAAVPGRRLDDPQGDQGRARPGPTRRRASRPARRRSRRRSAWPRRCAGSTRIGMDAVAAHEREIAAYALERLAEVPGLRVFGPRPSPERLGPVSFELDGVHAHDVSEILDRHGVAVRAGHHCAQPLMDRLGVAATARASFGVYTTPEEIDRLVEGLLDARRVFESRGPVLAAMDDLYRENILDHYKRPRNFGRPERVRPRVRGHQPALRRRAARVHRARRGRPGRARSAFEGKGCAISTAATSMLTEELAGKTREELLRLDKTRCSTCSGSRSRRRG